jgi:hypothetical protein
MQRVEWRREMTGHWIGLPVRWPDEEWLQWKRKGNWRMEGKPMGGFCDAWDRRLRLPERSDACVVPMGDCPE